jgi:uncharacterized phage protein gp47/JayE
MATFIKKDRGEILNQALDTLTKKTQITARNPGSIARALTEAFTTEIGDLYDVLDFNMSQSLISTATGINLDRIGELFGVNRRKLNQATIIEATSGSFYFYLNSVSTEDIMIPKGSNVYTDLGGYVGSQIKFETAAEVTLMAGRKKVFVPLLPVNSLARSTVGVGTLTKHSVTSPPGVTLRCNNPKSISAAPQYEIDSDYRIRITKQLRVRQKSSAEALRFALLSVDGVREAIVNSATYGLGGVEIIVVADANNRGPDFLRRVTQRVDQVRPVGIRVVLSTPTLISVDVSMKLVLSSGVTEREKTAIVSSVENDVKIYINSLMPNEPLVYNRLIQKILDVSEKIRDVQITKYAPNGRQAVRTNYQPAFNEQVIPGGISVSLAR